MHRSRGNAYHLGNLWDGKTVFHEIFEMVSRYKKSRPPSGSTRFYLWSISIKNTSCSVHNLPNTFNAILMYCLALSSLTFRPSVCLINRNYRIPRYASSIVSLSASIWSDETLLPSCVGTRALITLLSDGRTLAAAAITRFGDTDSGIIIANGMD